MIRRIFICLVILLSFAAVTMVAYAEDESILLKKSQLLIQKGSKAEERGDFEEAAALYEDALEVYPKNVMPLLRLGKLLARIGMYEKAAERLKAIPLNQLPKAGRSEIHLLLGRVAIARGSVEEAGAAFKQALDANPDNVVALIRKVITERLLGFSSSRENLERFEKYDSFDGLPRRELFLAFILDLQMGEMVRAYSSCKIICDQIAAAASESGEQSLSSMFFNSAPVSYVLSFPLAFNGILGGLYYGLLFFALVFLATRLSEPNAVWHNFLFVLAGTSFMLGAQHLCNRDLMIVLMQDDFSFYDSVWVIPNLLVSAHLVAFALFFIFPAFRILPAEQRPLRYELYGIWFFCWFFMIFVLVFQSRLGFATRATYMAISAFLAMITMIFMPLGRFVIFNVASAAGFSGVASVNRKDLQQAKTVSFTDAKILESQAWKLLEKDGFEEVVLTGRKVLACLERKTFASLWKAMILALISREDYVEAQRSIAEFVETFKGSTLLESGQLLDAYLRCRKGDFATAVVIIRGFSESRVKSFSSDETALCLLILGCCGVAFKELVQAHIDLGKAMNFAKLPFLKAEILTEMTELDFSMNAKEALLKWKAKAAEITGGEKTSSLMKVVLSMVTFSEGRKDEAMRLVEEACKSKIRNGRAFAWYGHLLCLDGRPGDAEELLGRMTPDSYDSIKLMNETTGTAP